MHIIAAKTPSVCIVFRVDVKVERSASSTCSDLAWISACVMYIYASTICHGIMLSTSPDL